MALPRQLCLRNLIIIVRLRSLQAKAFSTQLTITRHVEYDMWYDIFHRFESRNSRGLWRSFRLFLSPELFMVLNFKEIGYIKPLISMYSMIMQSEAYECIMFANAIMCLNEEIHFQDGLNSFVNLIKFRPFGSDVGVCGLRNQQWFSFCDSFELLRGFFAVKKMVYKYYITPDSCKSRTFFDPSSVFS